MIFDTTYLKNKNFIILIHLFIHLMIYYISKLYSINVSQRNYRHCVCLPIINFEINNTPIKHLLLIF